ncbi:hypothetical protein GCM10020295_01350 [Streptomyces cinereospinus]
MAAPAEMPARVVASLANGAAPASAPAPPASSTCRRDRATKMPITSTWKAMRRSLARSAVLMPRTFSAVVRAMKPTIHTQNGTLGNWAWRYAPPISQMTMGRKK